MWGALKRILGAYSEPNSLWGNTPTAVAIINNYLFMFMPLSPLLRMWATVFTAFFSFFAAGLTVSLIRDRSGSADLRNWLRRTVVWWTIAGFAAFGFYLCMIVVLERLSYNRFTSIILDIVQVALFLVPFACWSVAITAFAALFA